MGNVIMKAQQITYGTSNVEKALDDLNVPELIELNKRMAAIDAWKANVHEETYTGSELTIENALALPARSLKTVINAIQGLHGQPFPYVGGSQKNKYNISALNNSSSAAGITSTVNSDGTLSLTAGTASDEFVSALSYRTANEPIPFTAGEAYTFSIGTNKKQTSLVLQVLYRETSSSAWATLVNVQNVDSANFTMPSGTVYDLLIRLKVAAGNSITATTLYPMVCKSTESADWTPYSNICPISGRTAVGVNDHGKNFLALKLTDIKALNAQGTWVDNACTYDNVTYTCYTENDFVTEIKVNASAATTAQRDFVIYRDFDNSCPYNGYVLNGCPSNGSSSTFDLRVSDITTRSSADVGSGVTINLSDTGKWQAAITIRSGQTPSNVVYKPMIRPSGTSADFEPYKSSSATLILGTTVYGADINWDTGVMTVKTAFKTFDGSEGWAANGTIGYLITRSQSGMSDVKAASSANTYCLSNLFPKSGITWADKSIGIDGGTVWIGDADNVVFGDLAGFKSFLANTNLQLEYELATPTTIQLTPTQLEMLKGYNRVTIDNGSIELKALVLGGDY